MPKQGIGRLACAHAVANSGVRVNDASDFGKLPVEQSMRIEIARRDQRTLDDLAIEIGDDKVSGGQGGVIDSCLA